MSKVPLLLYYYLAIFATRGYQMILKPSDGSDNVWRELNCRRISVRTKPHARPNRWEDKDTGRFWVFKPIISSCSLPSESRFCRLVKTCDKKWTPDEGLGKCDLTPTTTSKAIFGSLRALVSLFNLFIIVINVRDADYKPLQSFFSHSTCWNGARSWHLLLFSFYDDD